MSLYDSTSIDRQILGFCLNNDFLVVQRTYWTGVCFREMRDIFDTLTYHHTTYNTDITVGELAVLFSDRYPAMPDSARKTYMS